MPGIYHASGVHSAYVYSTHTTTPHPAQPRTATKEKKKEVKRLDPFPIPSHSDAMRCPQSPEV